MGMIRNLVPERAFRLADAIPVREGSVVSMKLAGTPYFEASLYSFGNGESIAPAESFGDVFYYVLEGRAELALAAGQEQAGAGSALLVPHGNLHGIKANGGLQILYLQIFGKGENEMYIHNFAENEVVKLADQVSYGEGKIVSKSLVQRDDMTLTLFAFDAGEGVSTHASKGDALVTVLDGTAKIVVNGAEHTVSKGEAILMPATLPHSVTAVTPYKMMLTVVFPV